MLEGGLLPEWKGTETLIYSCSCQLGEMMEEGKQCLLTTHFLEWELCWLMLNAEHKRICDVKMGSQDFHFG